jgi:hypothetical protein
MFEALQDSGLAQVIGQSQLLTASLSSLHVVGFALTTGSALLVNLRLLGLVLAEVPASEVIRPALRALGVGLTTSVSTGALLFVPRAAGAVENPYFRTKVLLIAAGVLVHAFVQPRVAAGTQHRGLERLSGAMGLTVWLGVALAACAFILLE